jgi:hypothetical protein
MKAKKSTTKKNIKGCESGRALSAFLEYTLQHNFNFVDFYIM